MPPLKFQDTPDILMSVDTARAHMVKEQIRPQQVTDPKILEIFSRVPREDFVPAEYQSLAFAEIFIPLPHQQWMLSPALEGKILQALEIQPTDKILEIGTGSGYFTALLAHLSQHVYSVDYFEDLIDDAAEKFRLHHIYNVTLSHGKGANGWSSHAPYQAIVITGSLPSLPDNFKQQLAIGGRLVGIIGTGNTMKLMKITRIDDKHWEEITLSETQIPRLLDIKEPSTFQF